jgi:hypothetical protein
LDLDGLLEVEGRRGVAVLAAEELVGVALDELHRRRGEADLERVEVLEEERNFL